MYNFLKKEKTCIQHSLDGTRETRTLSPSVIREAPNSSVKSRGNCSRRERCERHAAGFLNLYRTSEERHFHRLATDNLRVSTTFFAAASNIGEQENISRARNRSSNSIRYSEGANGGGMFAERTELSARLCHRRRVATERIFLSRPKTGNTARCREIVIA